MARRRAGRRDQARAGSVGFDWLDPDNAVCRELDPALLQLFKHCDTNSPGFGTHKPTHACRISERSEWIVYPDRAVCQEELETMRANAP